MLRVAPLLEIELLTVRDAAEILARERAKR
jgi:hypothetical protein